MGRRKKRKLKRHHLQKYSANVIGVTSTVDKHYFREAAERAQAKDPFSEWFFKIDHIPDDLTREVQNARRNELGLQSSFGRSSREEVVAKLQKFREVKRIPVTHYVSLINRQYQKLLLCWNSDHDEYIFVQQDRRGHILRSLTYGERDRAMELFRSNRITWIERLD